MANICLHDGFIKVCCIAVLGHLPEGKAGDETVTSSLLECNRLGHRGFIGSLHQSFVRMVSCLWVCMCFVFSLDDHFVVLCLPICQRFLSSSKLAAVYPTLTGVRNAAARDRTALQLPLAPEIPTPNTHTPLNFCASSERPHIRCLLPCVSEITNFRLYGVKQKKEEFIERRPTLMLFSFRLIIPLIQLISALLTHR